MTDLAQARLGVLLLRLALGALFFAHGFIVAFFTFGMEGLVQFFVSLGLPSWLTHVVVVLETGGGILLILGVQARWVAMALTPIVVGSLVYVHMWNGWLFSFAGGGWEFPLYLFVLCIAQALLGDGPYALSPSISSPFQLFSPRSPTSEGRTP